MFSQKKPMEGIGADQSLLDVCQQKFGKFLCEVAPKKSNSYYAQHLFKGDSS
jgi:hypothetical protein